MLHIVSTLGPGGAQRQVVNLVNNLDHRVFDITLCCTNGAGLLARSLRPGVRLIVCEKRNWLGSIAVFFRLAQLIRHSRFDIVHTHLFSPGLWGRLAAWLGGVPVIVATEQGITPRKACLLVWVDRLLACVTSKVVAVSRAVADMRLWRERISSEKLVVIPNSIDLSVFCHPVPERVLDSLRQELALSKQDLVVGIVARLTPIKGLEDFLKAASLVVKQTPNVAFVIVGDGPLRAALEKLADDLGISGRVRFLGNRSDVDALLRLFDVAVLCSLSEACPLAILEYMAVGKPVVATDVGGVPEIVVDGETGYLVPARDAAALAERIGALLHDSLERAELGKNGSIRAQMFSAERIAGRYTALYRELLSDREVKGHGTASACSQDNLSIR